MAINQFGMDTDFQDFGGETESQEERKRRLARMAGLITGQGESAGQVIENRFNQANERLQNFTQAFENPEEQLQKRLGVQQPVQQAQPVQAPAVPTEDLANKEVQSTTVKTYGDGSQEEVVKKQIPAQQAVAAPQVPQEPVVQPQAVAAPQAPVQPEVTQAQPSMPVSPEQVAQTQLPQAGPGVQVASTQPGAGVAEAAQAARPVSPPPAAQPAPAVTQPPAPQEDQFQQQLIAARSEQDPAKRRQMYASLLANENVTEGNKALANRFIAEDYLKDRKMAEAEEKIAKATPNDLARYMNDRKEEGSYLKAILFQRLGLTELAKQEQEKINPTLKFESATDAAGNKFTVERNKEGVITRAFDATGRTASQEQIANLSAAAMPTQAHLLPQKSGSPVINSKGEMGTFMYDPITRQNYVLVGSEKRPTTGWTTMSQNIESVYGAAQARKGGEIAAETGVGQIPTAAPAAPATQQQVARLDGDIAGLQREINQPRNRGESEQAYQTRQTVLNAELQKAQQQRGQLVGTGGVQATGGVSGQGQRPGESYLQYKERLKREGELSTAAGKTDIDLQREERSNFLTYEEKEIIPKADAAGSIASTRKSQLKGPDGILANPEIVGMMGGQGGVATEIGNIVRDLVTGAKTDEELSQRVASLNLTQRQKDVLYNQIQLNRQIAPKTLKENAGAGSVSDAEQKANRDASINITKVPLYTAVTMLSKDQFDKDQTVARQAFRNSNPNLTTVRAFNDAWSKEKSRLDQEYNQIYEERAKYISKYYQDGKNPGAIVDAYKYYPVPEFNRQTGKWDYGTDYSRKAARPKLKSFEN